MSVQELLFAHVKNVCSPVGSIYKSTLFIMEGENLSKLEWKKFPFDGAMFYHFCSFKCIHRYSSEKSLKAHVAYMKQGSNVDTCGLGRNGLLILSKI